jgi:hypothetical protein
MAKGKKTGGKDFKPGQSGNPAGRAPLPPEVRALRTLNQIGFVRIANEMANKTVQELKRDHEGPETPAIRRAMAEQMIKAAEGATWSFDFLLTRMIGRAPDEPLKTDEERKLLELDDAELIAEAKKAAQVLLEAKS